MAVLTRPHRRRLLRALPREVYLNGRWAAAVPSILDDLDNWSIGDKAELIQSIRKGRSPCAYIFKCQVCGKLKGIWDCD